MDSTNLHVLIRTLDSLPSPPSHRVPVDRRLVLSCIRSNQWFHGVYDRADLPRQLEVVAEITGADLPWSIPNAYGQLRAQVGGHESFRAIASDVPIAASIEYAYQPDLQIWNLKNGGRLGRPFKLPPQSSSYKQGFVLSPDGSIVVLASLGGVYAIDWKAGRFLWQSPALDHEDYHGTVLAIGDKGKTLFTAGAHTVERWDFATGKRLAHLATSDQIVRVLKASADGRYLLAGFGPHNNTFRPNSYSLWESGNDRPVLEFAELEGANASLSPDGQTIVLSGFGERKFVIWQWRIGEKREVPIRNSVAASSAYDIYWSSNGKYGAAYLDSYPGSIFIYETATWKPLAHWPCGEIGHGSEFAFHPDGTLLQIRADSIYGLDVAKLKSRF